MTQNQVCEVGTGVYEEQEGHEVEPFQLGLDGWIILQPNDSQS